MQANRMDFLPTEIGQRLRGWGAKRITLVWSVPLLFQGKWQRVAKKGAGDGGGGSKTFLGRGFTVCFPLP